MAGGWLHSARPRRHPGMMYYGKDAIMDVRGIGLLDYLQRYEPDNLRRVSPGVFCTKEHDSLRISNGKWYWFSQGFGGCSALDYLIKVKNLPFTTAMERLHGSWDFWCSPWGKPPVWRPGRSPWKRRTCRCWTLWLRP